jgi:hypothetical protein
VAQPGLILVWTKGEPVVRKIPIPWATTFGIGRELVPEDDRTSAKHATIYARAGLDPDFVVNNTESRNGTFVDGKDVKHGYAWDGSVLRTGSSLFIATTDLARFEDEFSQLAYGAVIREAARAKAPQLPVHYSIVKRCLRSEWRDRAELVTAIEAAAARALATNDDRIGEEHLLGARPLQPTVPFAKYFELEMAAPPPFEIPAKYHVHSVQRLARGVPHETIIGSDAGRPDLVSVQLGDTLAKQPGYFMAGFWGHGVNSYSVYLAATTERSRLFLRLPYGAGAYSAAGERARALEQLERYWWLCETLPVVHVTLLDALGTAYYELVRPDGRVITSPEGLYSLDDIDFLTLAMS